MRITQSAYWITDFFSVGLNKDPELLISMYHRKFEKGRTAQSPVVEKFR